VGSTTLVTGGFRGESRTLRTIGERPGGAGNDARVRGEIGRPGRHGLVV
jgi:hypothetical protein